MGWIDDGDVKPSDTVRLTFMRDGVEVNLETEAGNVGEKIKQQHNRTGGNEVVVTGISALNPRLSIAEPRRSAYDALNMTTESPGFANRVSTSLPYKSRLSGGANTENPHGDTADNWNNITDGTDRRSYRRMMITGQALSAVSADGSAGQMIGGLAQLMGDIGPEAEKVLAPGFKRVAYRYRGTEKRPDEHLVRQVETANAVLGEIDPVMPQGATADHPKMIEAEERRAEIVGASLAPGDPNNITAYYASQTKLTSDQKALRTRGDLAVLDLVDKLPDPKLTKLNLKAGATPPSQGIMIDGDGNVVSQAQGFNGDHYLPFDLKNLKSLHGGQYARTRAHGGPTSEDIYTGLLSGARQMQVVSNSGVFTVEFDPDLRGGRRYSDKATKMVERYAHLLDAVDSGGLLRQDIDPKKMEELYTTAMESRNWDKKLGTDAFNEAVEIERLKSSGGISTGLLEGDETLKRTVERIVESKIGDMPQKTIAAMSRQQYQGMKDDMTREETAKEREKTVQAYKLDGDGYYDALKALQAEFPYYIRDVQYKEFPQFFGDRKLGRGPKGSAFTPDRSHVAPGQTNSASEHKGFWNANVKAGSAQANRDKKVKQDAEEAKRTGVTGFGAQASAGAGYTAPSSPGGPSQNITLAGVRFSPDRETVSFKQAIASGSDVQNKMTSEISKVMNGVFSAGALTPSVLPLPSHADAPEHEALIEDMTAPTTFLAWKWNNIGADNKAVRFTNWLLNEASPEARQRIVDNLRHLPEAINTGLDPAQAAKINANIGDFQGKLDMITDLADLASPLVNGDADVMTHAPIHEARPKPMLVREVEALGVTLKNYNQFEKSAATSPTGKPLLDRISQFEGKSNVEIAQTIFDQQKAYKAAEKKFAQPQEKQTLRSSIELSQQAWAFKHGKHLAEIYDKIAGGDSSPKAGAGNPALPTPGTASKGLVGKSYQDQQFSDLEIAQYLGLL
jgi:hypothetical protein